MTPINQYMLRIFVTGISSFIATAYCWKLVSKNKAVGITKRFFVLYGLAFVACMFQKVFNILYLTL